jgi:hypothetical protein
MYIRMVGYELFFLCKTKFYIELMEIMIFKYGDLDTTFLACQVYQMVQIAICQVYVIVQPIVLNKMPLYMDCV